jgi:hypothetical protein
VKFTYTKATPKVAAVCSRDESKPELCHPFLNVELGELQATDRYMAVRVPVEVEKGETTGPLDVKLIADGQKIKASAIKIPKKAKDRPNVKFPELPTLWPSAKEIANPAFRVGFNAGLLKKITDALESADGLVELIFPSYSKDGTPDALKPIIVRARVAEPRKDGPKGSVAQPEALLMPVRLGGEVVAVPAKAPATAKAAPTSDRSAAAFKAAETRRRNKEAANGNGGKSKGKKAVAAAVRQVAKKQPGDITTAAGRRAKTKPTNGKADFGKGSPARLAAAAKAAATRRARLAAA